MQPVTVTVTVTVTVGIDPTIWDFSPLLAPAPLTFYCTGSPYAGSYACIPGRTGVVRTRVRPGRRR